ncbi:MAG: hypothetical protein ACI84O_000448 [Myxococcota bacterium]|jgi:hypothetical protein
MTTNLPPAIQKCLQRLQRRMLAVRVFRGVGLLLLALCAIVIISVAFDYLLQPPSTVRIVHSVAAVLGSLYLLNRWVLRPLRHRPNSAQLAAIIERHFELDDRLSSSVELAGTQQVAAGSFIEALIEQTVADCHDLAPQKIYKLSTPAYMFCSAVTSCVALLACANYFPQLNAIFWQRMSGADIAWPANTELVFVIDQLDPNQNLISSTSPKHLVLHTSDPGNLVLQVRAIGDLPERIVLHGLSRSHAMTPLGGGDFVYNLPPLASDTVFSLSGGDHRSDSSSLSVVVGEAPLLNDWQVAVTSPAYTMLAAEISEAQELRVITDALIDISFKVSDGTSDVTLSLDSELAIDLIDDGSGAYRTTIHALESDALTIQIKNADGFSSYYPRHLSWRVYADVAPQIEVMYPQRNFHAVAGGMMPLALRLSDDFALNHLRLLDKGDEELTAEALNGLTAQRFWNLEVPAFNNDDLNANNHFIEVIVEDNQQPSPNQASLRSVNYYVQDINGAELYLSNEVQKLRRGLEQMRDKLDVFAKLETRASNFEVRRILDALTNSIEQSEWLLTERLFSKIDDNPPATLEALQSLLNTQSGAGQVVEVIASNNASALIGRSSDLWQLANALVSAYNIHGNALETALSNGDELQGLFVKLRDEIDVILETVVSWEDYQSAVNLLRQLIERQRGLYLRTQEVAL